MGEIVDKCFKQLATMNKQKEPKVIELSVVTGKKAQVYQVIWICTYGGISFNLVPESKSHKCSSSEVTHPADCKGTHQNK